MEAVQPLESIGEGEGSPPDLREGLARFLSQD
jgi:hypothetical protein